MTKKKARKRIVRERAAKTGESYTSALRQLRTSKERTMTSPTTTTTTSTTCALCNDGDSSDFVVAGLTFCRDCHDRLTAAAYSQVDVEVGRTRRPLAYFISALVIVPDDETSWVVHLHTFQPGLVVGQKGETANRIRQALVTVTGHDRLRLNIVPHEVFGCHTESAEAEGASSTKA